MIFFGTESKQVIRASFTQSFTLALLVLALIWSTAATAQTNSTYTNPVAAINSVQIADSTYTFQAGTLQTPINNSNWAGSLKKMRIVQSADGQVSIAKEAEWDAATLLATVSYKRTIATSNSAHKQTVAFEFNQLPGEIQTLLNHSPSTGIKDDLGLERVNYLTGDRKMESKNANSTTPSFPVRSSLLGDIIHSVPVFMGTPTLNVIDPNYASFYAQHKARPGTVFVGANDGMLHAFSADSGVELFAYIPSPLLKKLPQLTDQKNQPELISVIQNRNGQSVEAERTTGAAVYKKLNADCAKGAPSNDVDTVDIEKGLTMDGNIRVSEARSSGAWITVLAAGMGGGAKGIFALDVTTPNHFMEGKRALFEFTENDDPDIGYITAAPLIAKVKNRYFVVVPNGYNPTHQHTEQFLFLLSLDKDPAAPWSFNHNYYKLSANSSSPATTHVLSQPGFAFDAQGSAIFAYAGDWQGNLWRFDLTNLTAPTQTAKVIFTAKDQHHQLQSISIQPLVTFAPNGGYLILFGTSKNSEDSSDAPQQSQQSQQNSFYAIRDKPTTDNFISDRSHLAERKLVKTTIHGQTGYQVTGDDFTYGMTKLDKSGWYFDYPHGDVTGERTIFDAVIANGMLFFNTVLSEATLPTSGCHNNTSNSYRLNVLSGKSINTDSVTGITSNAGILGTPIILNTKLTMGDPNSVGQRNSTQHFALVNFGTGGSNGFAEIIQQDKVQLKTGRLSWREVSNWHEIRKRK